MIFRDDGCANKLLIFLYVKYDDPFLLKKWVMGAAFMSRILYECEGWLKAPLKSVESLYDFSKSTTTPPKLE